MARPKPLADFIDSCLGPALRAQGFAASDVITAWPEIAGERLAAFRARSGSNGRAAGGPTPTRGRSRQRSIVRVESAFALELQHLAPLLIERINAHYGWRCVGRLVLKQGPVPRPKPARPAPPELSPEDRARLAETTAGIADEPLREALTRLGGAVVAGARTKA